MELNMGSRTMRLADYQHRVIPRLARQAGAASFRFRFRFDAV